MGIFTKKATPAITWPIRSFAASNQLKSRSASASSLLLVSRFTDLVSQLPAFLTSIARWNAKTLTAQRSQALRSAVLGKRTEIARLLLESGVDIDQPSPDSKLSPF